MSLMSFSFFKNDFQWLKTCWKRI